MHVDLLVALAGLLVGFVVGLTGMGGGALMTPILVLGFGVQPLAAVSSDLVAAVVMKPIGGGVHLRRGTVHLGLVRWLCIGSVPAAFAGVLVLEAMGDGAALQHRIEVLLGVALVVAAVAIVARNLVQQGRSGAASVHDIEPRVVPTIVIGVLGGLVVGLTSVGSGSLMIVLLLLLYPSLRAADLVGTDLVQAIPLVVSAALGHLVFGDVQLSVTASLLLGSIPGVYLGARASASAPDDLIRPALVIVLLVSGLKLLGADNTVLAGVVAAGAVVFAAVARHTVASRRRVHHVVRGHREVLEEPPLDIGIELGFEDGR